MRRLATAAFGALLMLALGTTVADAGWKLTFSDEFNAPALDRFRWKLSDQWNNQTLSGNGEKQCYEPEAVSQSGGFLRLTATRSPRPAATCKGATFDLLYASGMVTTTGCNRYDTSPKCARLKAFSQAFGYFEVRAKLPKGKGFWPAFWLLPDDHSWPPEIDVMEELGRAPSTIVQTYHYDDEKGGHQKQAYAYEGHDFTSSFSTFGVDWRPGLIIWYVDGRETFRVSGPIVTSKKMNILINLAVGGYWPGDPDETTPFPSSLLVDYVRVYTRVDNGVSDELPPH